jgi:hypothetical protein
VKSGKAFETRESAAADFKSKYGSTYTSKYKTEPAKRPEHIPASTTVGGKTYNITYNQSSGGYGYWNGGGPGLGTFIMYDMMSDAIMMNTMMSRHDYYVGPPLSTGWSGLCTFFVVLGAAGVIIFVGVIVLSK